MAEEDRSTEKGFAIFARLYRWLYLKRCEWIIKAVRKNQLLSQRTLLDTFKAEYTETTEDFRSELGFLVIMQLYENRIPEANTDFYEQNQKLVLAEVEKAKNVEEIKSRLNLHLEFMRYYFNDILQLPDDYPLKEKLQDPQIAVLSTKEFKRKAKEVSRQLRTVKKEVRAKLKEKKEKEEYERLPKIEITSPHISVILGLFSVLFLCTGFFYNVLFLGYFGIELSKFFSVSDYLASSIDKVYYSFISIVAGMTIGFFLYPEYLKGEIPVVRRSRFVRFFDRSLMPLMGALVVLGYLQKNYYGFYWALHIFLLLLFIHIILYFLKYFKNPLRSYVILLATTWFFLSIFLGAVKDISSIYREKTEDIKKYHIIFKEGIALHEEDLIFLASNTKYAFFYDKKREKTMVLPTRDIDRIEIRKRKPMGKLIPVIVDRFRGNTLNH